MIEPVVIRLEITMAGAFRKQFMQRWPWELELGGAGDKGKTPLLIVVREIVFPVFLEQSCSARL